MSTSSHETSDDSTSKRYFNQRRQTTRRCTSHKESSRARQGFRKGVNLRRKAPALLAQQSAWYLLDFSIGVSVPTFLAFVQVLRHLPYVTMTGVERNLHAYLLPVWIFAIGIAALSRLAGLQSFEDRRGALAEVALIGQIAMVSVFGVYGMLRFFQFTEPPRRLLLAAVILTAAAMILSRIIWRYHRHLRFQNDAHERSVLIVGTDAVGAEVRDYLSSLRHSGIHFVGFVTLEEDSDDPSVAQEGEILGSVHNLISLARSRFVDEIIFSRRPVTPGVLSSTLDQARSMGIDIRLIPSLSETLKYRADVQYIGALPTIAIHQRKLRTYPLLLKRAMDIVVASGGLLLVLPLLILVALAVKRESPGSVFYLSKRVGYKGYVFTCYKFRTMLQSADAMRAELAHLNEREGILFKIARDPRVTAVGAFLRKYSLDELPQLWNVIKGDMSLVGPRPSISSEVGQYRTADMRRLDVVPGMTGLWQVEGRKDPSFETYIMLDSEYVSNWSLLLDLTILCRTVRAVLVGTGT